MRNNFKMIFKSMEGGEDLKLIQPALDFFYSWSAEGGLTDNINPSMRQNVQREIYLTGSTPDSLTFTVVETPANVIKR